MHSINRWIKVILELHLSFYLNTPIHVLKNASPSEGHQTMATGNPRHSQFTHTWPHWCTQTIQRPPSSLYRQGTIALFSYTMLIVLPSLCIYPIFRTKVSAQVTIECAFISPHSTGSENLYSYFSIYIHNPYSVHCEGLMCTDSWRTLHYTLTTLAYDEGLFTVYGTITH